MTGKPGVAPCGHIGVHVIGTYVACLAGCDAVPEHVDPEKTEPIGVCPLCKRGIGRCTCSYGQLDLSLDD